MKKKYLLGVGSHICSTCCLKANTTIMPVYTCLYSSPLHTKHSKTKTEQRGQHNTGWHQGDRALLLLSAWGPIHKVLHHSLFTQNKLSISTSAEWVLVCPRGFWVNWGTKEASSSAVNKLESTSDPRKVQLKTLELYLVISSDEMCFQNCFISSCQSLFNLWVNPLLPSKNDH